MYYVYILKTKDNKKYIGCTNSIKQRLERHNQGYVPATKNIRPIKLLCYFALSDRYRAYNLEKYLKTGSGRAFLNKRFL